MTRPYRSVLYIPASRERALEKARELAADAIIFDLEDAVSPEEKVRARELLAGVLAGADYGARARIVRMNGLGTEWVEGDLAAFGAHFVIQVGAVKGRTVNFGSFKLKIFNNVVAHFRRGCCRKCHNRGINVNGIYHFAYASVFGPEIVPPFRYTVGFVNGHKRHFELHEKINTVLFGKGFGGNV